jgi:hypothetical protein
MYYELYLLLSILTYFTICVPVRHTMAQAFPNLSFPDDHSGIPVMAKYFQRGAAIRACLNSSACKS